MGSTPRPSRDHAVRSAIEPGLGALGLDIEDIDIQASGRRRRVCVVVDRDGGVDLDGLAEASRAVSEALDASDAMGEDPYTLEVTSPGIDRPLTLPRHWHRNVGRRVRVILRDGSAVEGRVTAVAEDGVVLAVDEGSRGEIAEWRAPWGDVLRGEVQIEFTRPGKEEG